MRSARVIDSPSHTEPAAQAKAARTRVSGLQRWALALAIASVAGATQAAEGWEASLIGGRGDGIDVRALAVRVPVWRFERTLGGWPIDVRAEGAIGDWRGRGRASSGSPERVYSLSFTPIFTATSSREDGWRPYVEAGVGLHILSHTRINGDREFASGLQFGEVLGAGLRFGDRYAVGVRVRHVSNGGLKQPNDGATFGELVLTMRFS